MTVVTYPNSITLAASGTQGSVTGTATLEVADPEQQIASVSFEVEVLHLDGTRSHSGPFRLDVPSTSQEGYDLYTREVLLDAQDDTRIQPIVTLRSGEVLRPEAVTFGPRTGVGGDLALRNFRETSRTDTEVVYSWERGERVAEVWVFDTERAEPVTGDPWPREGGEDPRVLPIENEYTARAPAPGAVRYLQFEPRDAQMNAGAVQRVKVEQIATTDPYFEHIAQTPGSTPGTTDLRVRVVDPRGRGGTLTAWLNRLSGDSADPDATPDGTMAVPGTPYEASSAALWTLPGGGTAALLDEIRVHAGRGKRIYLQFTTADGATTGKVDHTLLSWIDVIDENGELGDDAISRPAQFAAGLRPPKVVDALPAGNPEGLSVVLLTTDRKLYRWSGTEWTAAVDAGDLDGKITETQIAPGSISTPLLKAGAIRAKLVSTDRITANDVLAGAIEAGAIGADQLAAGSVTTAKLDVASHFLQGVTWSHDAPSAGSISWSAGELSYRGVRYAIAAGSTAQEVVWWDRDAPNSLQGDSSASFGDKVQSGAFDGTADQVIAYNEGGRAREVWNGTMIAGGMIVTKSIAAEKIRVTELSDFKAPDGTSIGLGIVVSGTLVSDPGGTSQGRAYIDLNPAAGGHILHAEDASGNPTFYVDDTGNAVFSGTVEASRFTTPRAEFEGAVWLRGRLVGQSDGHPTSSSAYLRWGDTFATPFFGNPNAARLYGDYDILGMRMKDITLEWSASGGNSWSPLYRFGANGHFTSTYVDVTQSMTVGQTITSYGHPVGFIVDSPSPPAGIEGMIWVS